MSKAMGKLSIKFLTLGILSGTLWFFYNNYGFSQTTQLRVMAAQQPDAPLLILSTYIDSSDPLKPRFGYSLTNMSNKPVRAYTIQEGFSLSERGGPIIYTHFVHMPAVKLFLKPNELRQEDGGRGSTFQSPPIKVELSVDFVEFTDGTRWGEDTSKSGERLDGMRAGGKAAIKRYREILAIEGINGLEQALGNSDLVQAENQSKPVEWSDGFRAGVSFVKGRLSEAKTKGGQDGIKRELERPFDSTEGRQEP